MEELKAEHFEDIKEDNSKEESEKQWEKSKIIFDHFFNYLKDKGLKENTAGKRTQMCVYFIMNYLFVYDDATSVLEVTDKTIRTFLGNWYIRKFMNPNISEIKAFLKSISDFFTFLQVRSFISKEDLIKIKDACKDTDWFEMRLTTYFKAHGYDLREWIEEYNYDW